METGAIIVWTILGTVVIALFIWWWRGVHSKSKAHQAAEVLRVRGARSARNQEKNAAGGTSYAGLGEYMKGATEPEPAPVILPPDSSADDEGPSSIKGR